LRQRNLSKNVGEALQATWRQGDGHGQGVDDPSKDGFAGSPIGVSLEHFFDRGGLIVKDAVIGVHWAKNLIDGGKQDAADTIQMGGGTLGSTDKVVNKNINGGKLATIGVVQVWVTKQGSGQWRRQSVSHTRSGDH
jgi:hypothetical protein